MACNVNDLAEDVRFSKRKLGNLENHGENPPVVFLKEDLKGQKIKFVEDADSDYVKYLMGDMSIPDDPEHELSVEGVGDDPHHKLSVEASGDDDPQYKLFLSGLKKHGSSYILQVDGLYKPIQYEEDESDDEGQDHLFETQWGKSEIDADYASFLDCLSVKGPNAIDQSDDCLPVEYDLPISQKDNGTASRTRKSKLSIDKEKSCDNSEEDSNSQCASGRRKMHSKFREQIMKILRKPYDKQEHKELLQAITEKKGQDRHIDLRGRAVKFCRSNKKGKSYLDHHWDLKRKVQAAVKDDHKQLNLLRGFFFWIENLTQDGSFMPWNDKECLTVQPQEVSVLKFQY